MADGLGDPSDPNYLKRHATIGPGGAKIAWGTPGDWTRCFNRMRRLGVPGQEAREFCARWHIEMNGFATGSKLNR